MAYVKEYWTDKEKRARKAKDHTLYMYGKYSEEIELSVSKTKIYDNPFIELSKTDAAVKSTHIIIEDIDSVSAVLKYGGENTAVLNFSSYKNPGGMFLQGSKAQEECLCHESFLYNVISRFNIPFYDWNNRHKNKALYTNRALYSPIIFERGGVVKMANVITCAAPNKSAAQKYQNVTDDENYMVLQSRIKFVLDIARDNGVKTLILGAYGCGVFGQDATEVANIFKQYLDTEYKCFDTVVFAIPYGRDRNLLKFQEVFKENL